MTTFTKEQLTASAHARIEFAEMMLAGELEPLKARTWSIELELARIALASLEAEPVYQWRERYEDSDLWDDCTKEQYEGFAKQPEIETRILYTAPPAPVVPGVYIRDERGRMMLNGVCELKIGFGEGWNACRAAMQGKAEPVSQPYKFPATMFKPVADLYGITSPTGSETTFTFDAVEARDFINGGYSVQEYVKLERYQQAVVGNSPAIPDELIRRIAFNLVYLAADEKLRSDEDSLFALVRRAIDEVRKELSAYA